MVCKLQCPLDHSVQLKNNTYQDISCCFQLLLQSQLVKTEGVAPSIVTLTTAPTTGVTQTTVTPAVQTTPVVQNVTSANAIVTTTIPVQVRIL